MPKPKPKKKRKARRGLSAENSDLAVTTIVMLTTERTAFRNALRDLLVLYDRVAGNVSNGSGWTYADGKRMEEIRRLVASD